MALLLDITLQEKRLSNRPGKVDPNVAKAGGLQIQGANGETAVFCSTANPWQHRIWSPPAFPEGVKKIDIEHLLGIIWGQFQTWGWILNERRHP